MMFKEGIEVRVKEREDGLGIVISIFKNRQLIDSTIYWYLEMRVR